MYPHQWFLPTFHGDILLESKGDKETQLRAFQLTPTEEKAMERLRARALHKSGYGKAWAEEGEFPPLTTTSYRSKEGLTIVLRAPLLAVHAIVASALKPGTKLLHAVRFSDGSLEQAHEAAPPAPAKAAGPAKAADPPPVEVPKPKAKDAKPDKAVTVAKPTEGCPAPAFAEAAIRATRVLEAFLTEEQIDDYRRYGGFVATGADSGHRYMIANRERPSVTAHYGSRSLYDLDEQRPLCVHDWTVPAPEEMLALMLCVSLPGNEGALRKMQAVWH